MEWNYKNSHPLNFMLIFTFKFMVTSRWKCSKHAVLPAGNMASLGILEYRNNSEF